ncbi:MAG: immunoglobulin domain-containing protein, partial [Verrucomicrobiae bacterium]|nr:immunoglobulin domain-containing protein [Verrucomicrobiae bacterium]
PLDDDDHVSGSDGNVLRFRDLTGIQDGVYTVTVSNGWGTITSQPAVLTVNDPLILTEPDDHAPAIGESITLSVEATSSVPPLSHQWWKDGEPIPGAVEASLELTDVQPEDAGRYWVVVSCPVGATSSSIAELDINGALPDPDFRFCLTSDRNSPEVLAFAAEPDGAVLVAGYFHAVAGLPYTNVVRFLPDNTVDPSFTPVPGSPYLPVNMLAVQPDRRILIGERFHFARYFPDGALDGSFAIDTERIVEGFGLQPDGRMVVSAYLPRDVVRWLPDGSVEPGFTPECDGVIWTLVLQPDGKIVVGGGFSTLAGSPRDNVGRLNPDGTLDEPFNPDVGNYPGSIVHTLALQPDGKILVGGMFGQVGGTSIRNLVRLFPDGSLDSEFKPQAGQSPWSLLLQANGKILVGGVTQIDGHVRNGLSRLLPDGRVEIGFNPPSGYYNCLGVQKDGAILTWGTSTNATGEVCRQIGRLLNPDAATESLEYIQNTLTWMRGGGGPEVWRTTFEYSSDGTEWTLLGGGARIAGGWQLATSPRLESGTVRARGYAVVGDGNASTWFVETLLPLGESVTPQILLGDGSPRFTEAGFGFDLTGTPGATVG